MAKNIEGSWKALAFDMAKPIEQQKKQPNKPKQPTKKKQPTGITLNKEQLAIHASGKISEIGFNLYHDLLKRTIQAIKNNTKIILEAIKRRVQKT